MAGVALHFAWHAWHLWHWADSGGALGSVLVAAPSLFRRRRGTWSHPPSLCVAGVALGDIHLRFVWQAWHLVTSTFVLRGKRGTYGTGPARVARLGRF